MPLWSAFSSSSATGPGVEEHGVGVDVEPRLEHEGALVGARVRQPEDVLVAATVADDDQVDVERARRVPDLAALAVEGVLDRQRAVHQPATAASVVSISTTALRKFSEPSGASTGSVS